MKSKIGRWIHGAELRARFGITNSTVYRWIDSGNLPPGIPIGGERVSWPDYEVAEIESALLARRDVRAVVHQLLERRQQPSIDRAIQTTPSTWRPARLDGVALTGARPSTLSRRPARSESSKAEPRSRKRRNTGGETARRRSRT